MADQNTAAALTLERAGMSEVLIHAAGTVSGLSFEDFAARQPKLRAALSALVEALQPEQPPNDA